jgi:hypothetical protein
MHGAKIWFSISNNIFKLPKEHFVTGFVGFNYKL